MSYGEFKEELLKELRDFYGKDAEVAICEIKHNNGQSYDGVQIVLKKAERYVTPVISLKSIYESYSNGSMKMEDCVEEIYREREKYEATEDILRFTDSLMDWDAVKGHIYPILISTKENAEMLEELVSFPMLDLSVAYIIRMETAEGNQGRVKMKRQMLEQYGIEALQLHRQAMENLDKDGYGFQDIMTMAFDGCKSGMEYGTEEDHEEEAKGITPVEMYVLTNASKSYGAAGILNKKLIREFAGKQNFYILPSSIHETIFVPAHNKSEQEIFDSMVVDVNEAQVDVEERLSNHCYYYDGRTEEIRMCA